MINGRVEDLSALEQVGSGVGVIPGGSTAKRVVGGLADAGKGLFRGGKELFGSIGGFFRKRTIPVAPRATVRPDLAGHIRLRDTSIARSKGIGGAHNLDEFNAAAAAEGIHVHRITPHPTQLGLQKVEYQIRALDRAGNPAGFKAKVFEKTIYDPRLISDSDMLRLGREAADNALARGALTREWTGTASNGMQFRGYLDSSGAVPSFFPEF